MLFLAYFIYHNFGLWCDIMDPNLNIFRLSNSPVYEGINVIEKFHVKLSYVNSYQEGEYLI